MKRIFLLVLTIFSLFCLVGCKTSKNTKEDFLKKISTVEGYKVDGILETFFENGRKQSEFEVCYKKNDYYKVVLQSIENSDKQIILKNDDGVFVLVPSVNKNFKIKSTWPSNASYPYLLQSLAQDIANDSDQIVTENEATYTSPLQVGASMGLGSINPFGIHYQIKEGEAYLDIANYNINLAKSDIYWEVQENYINMRQLERKIPLMNQKVKATLENFELADGRYSVGLNNYVELQDALANYNNSQLNFVEAVFQYNVARETLRKSMGEK